MTDTPPPPRPRPTAAPAPLTAAAALVAVEALLLMLYGVAEIFAVSAERVAMAVTTAVFFLVYGAGLLTCAWALTRLRSWARSPVVLAQLIQLGVAWSFRGGATTSVAIVLAAVAVLVVVGIFHPASVTALADDD